MKNLLRLARPGSLEPLDFQTDGVLERFAGVTHEACMAAMMVIAPDGRRWVGAEAAVRALMTRWFLVPIVAMYYVPGIRQLLDWIYGRIAARRYEIAGKMVAEGGCDSSGCAVHFGQSEINPSPEGPSPDRDPAPRSE